MSRHMNQIKSLLDNKMLNRSRFNPESTIKSVSQIEEYKRNRSLPRAESSVNLRNKQSQQMILIQQRYRKLQTNYREVLQETKIRAKQFAKQKVELEKYKVQSQKDKKQIQRLRSMLGFMKKQDYAVQVQLNNDSIVNQSKNLYNFSSSFLKINEKSIMVESADNWKIKERKNSSDKINMSRVNTPSKILNSKKSQPMINFHRSMNQSSLRSPLAKYKFIPSLNIN